MEINLVKKELDLQLKSKKIKEVTFEGNCQELYLTFDIDWCSDEVLSYTLDFVEKYNIKATFFVTHETKLLERMRNNSNIELGIHPNFNPLLNGDFRYGKNIDEVIEYYKSIVPEAISSRSHSLTQSAQILQSMIKHGIKYDCNIFIPFDSDIKIKPYNCLNKSITRIPYMWEDDLHEYNKWDYDEILKTLDINFFNVLDFHPIHIFLNSYDMSNYNSAREHLHDTYELKKFINNDCYGSKDFLEEIIKKVIN